MHAAATLTNQVVDGPLFPILPLSTQDGGRYLVTGNPRVLEFPGSLDRTTKIGLSTCSYASAAVFILKYATLLIMDNLLMGYRLPWSKKSEDARKPDLSRIHCVNDVSILNRLAYRRDRTRFGLSPGVVLQGYPSQKGGVWVLEGVLGVELDFLGLDRFQDTPRVPEPYVDDEGVIVMPEDEDEWCSKLRQLGAIWWASEDTYMDYNLGMDIPQRSKEDSEVIKVGYPATGGVWVLNLPRHEASKKGVGIVYNAHSMEERCRVIELLGGVFYANPDDSPELDLKGEGRRSGRVGVSEMGLDEELQEMEIEMKND